MCTETANRVYIFHVHLQTFSRPWRVHLLCFPRLEGLLSGRPELIWWLGWRRRTCQSGTPGRCGSHTCWGGGCTRTVGAPGPPFAPACWGRRSEPWQALACSQTTWLPPAGCHRLVCRCRRSSSVVWDISLQASREWFWPERRGQQEGFHRWRNLQSERQQRRPPEGNVSGPSLRPVAGQTPWQRRTGTPSPSHGPEHQCILGVVQTEWCQYAVVE